MSLCDNCGKFFRGGGLQSGSFEFCSGICKEQGAVLSLLDEIPAIKVQDYVESLYRRACPECKGKGPCDMHPAHFALATKRGTQSIFSCRICARKRQVKAILQSLVLGWWRMPWGLLFTPAHVLRNLFVLAFPVDRNGPSRELRRVARLQYARHLSNLASKALE